MPEQSSDPRSLLYRPEILSAQTYHSGAISLVQPASTTLITIVAICIAVGLAVFATTGEYSKKARITGITAPVSGSLTILSSNSGIISHFFVSEGQRVKTGQKLFELSTERQSQHGEVAELVEQQLKIRMEALEGERKAQIKNAHNKSIAIDAKLESIMVEEEHLRQQIILTEHRESLATGTFKKFQALQANGFVSELQTQQKQEDLLDISARLSSLRQNLAQLEENYITTKREKTDLEGELESAQSELNILTANLMQEFAENQSKRANFIVAPKDGTLTTISGEVGQAVSAGQIIATLLPKDSKSQSKEELEVQLFAPSRNAGFLSIGQPVLIRYQAFPYQKFGLYNGRVVDVSNTPLSPAELPANLAGTIISNAQSVLGSSSSESMYRIKVSIAQQNIKVYDRSIKLKPGMTVEADIIQDHRKIWEWIFEPLLAVAHR